MSTGENDDLVAEDLVHHAVRKPVKQCATDLPFFGHGSMHLWKDREHLNRRIEFAKDGTAEPTDL